MKAPDKIYIQMSSAIPGIGFVGPAWDNSRNNMGLSEYINKDALLEWAKEKQYESLTIVADNFWQEVIDKLNEM